MSHKKVKLLEQQVKMLQEALHYYKNLDIKLVKDTNEHFETVLGQKFHADEDMDKLLETVKSKFTPQTTNTRNRYKPNPFQNKAKYALNKVEMVDRILNELDGGQQIIITDKDFVYTNEAFIDNIPHDLVIDGNQIKNSQQMYETICANLGMLSDSDLSNINPTYKTIIIVTNYAKMINKMDNEDMREWACHLRNTMENERPLLFVLLNADEQDRTFLINSDLVARLIQFSN